MTYTVIVLDRGRPIARHAGLELLVSQELVATYRALGWPDEKVHLEEDEPRYDERPAA
jgi:hypothetical protein